MLPVGHLIDLDGQRLGHPPDRLPEDGVWAGDAEEEQLCCCTGLQVEDLRKRLEQSGARMGAP